MLKLYLRALAVFACYLSSATAMNASSIDGVMVDTVGQPLDLPGSARSIRFLFKSKPNFRPSREGSSKLKPSLRVVPVIHFDSTSSVSSISPPTSVRSKSPKTSTRNNYRLSSYFAMSDSKPDFLLSHNNTLIDEFHLAIKLHILRFTRLTQVIKSIPFNHSKLKQRYRRLLYQSVGKGQHQWSKLLFLTSKIISHDSYRYTYCKNEEISRVFESAARKCIFLMRREDGGKDEEWNNCLLRTRQELQLWTRTL